jgi:hypothetical protein
MSSTPKRPSIITEGVAEQILNQDQPDIQTVAESDLGRIAREEAFMHEPVKIVVHATTDPNAPPYVRLTVNGDGVTVFRDVPTVIKRKHLEVLARMKETRIAQNMQPDANGEITINNLRSYTGLAYPFVVVEDKNPKGGAWLANILAERG